MSELFDEPLFLAVAYTACFVALWSTWRWHRKGVAERAAFHRWFLTDGQFKEAMPVELEALQGLARERGAGTAALASLERIRIAYGDPLRAGHLWWITQQIAGTIPFEQIAPPCIPGDGVDKMHPAADRSA